MKSLLQNLSIEHRDLTLQIGVLAQKLGMKAYLVGGPVRDLMLGVPNIDLDIVVEGNCLRLAKVLAQAHHISNPVLYPAFKTATVKLLQGWQIDFVTARKETYSKGGAYPKVAPSTIKEDLFRRDFTINAMAIAINPKSWGKIVDPYNGRLDLKAQKIRVLHGTSFIDDPTRILRAARFMARFGFKMETQTLKLLKSAVKMKVLDTIKPQRYLKDFKKIEKEPKALDAIKCLKAWNVDTKGVFE